MKKKNERIGIALFAAMVALVLAGCEQVEGIKLSAEAGLTSITVAGNPATLGTPGEYSTVAVPEVPVEGYVGVPTDKLGGAIITTVKPEGASTWFAITNREVPDPVFSGNPVEETTIAIGRGEYLNVRVRSEDGNRQLIYRILFQELTQISTLQSVTVAGTAALLGFPGATLADITASPAEGNSFQPGSVTFLPADKDDAPVVTVKTAEDATVTYAAATSLTNTGLNFVETAPTAFTDGSYLYIKVVSQDLSFTSIYAIKVMLRNNDPTVTGITVGGVTATIGTGGTAVNVGTGAGLRGAVSLQGNQANDPAIIVTTNDDKATVTGYAIVASTNNAPTFIPVESKSFNYTGSVPTGYHLFIRAVAENAATTRYYRIVLTVQSNVVELNQLTWGGIVTPVSMLGDGATTWADLNANNSGELPVSDAQVTAQSIAIILTTNFNGVRSWGISSAGTAEPTWGTTTPITSFAADDYLGVKVVSADSSNTKYYRAKIVVDNRSPVATLSGITVGGIATTGGTSGVGTPNANPLSVTVAQAAKVQFVDGQTLKTAKVVPSATAEAGPQTYRYAKVAQTKDPFVLSDLVFSATDTFDFSPAGGDQIYIEVTAERGAPINYYRVWASRAVDVNYVAPAQVPMITGTTGDTANEVVDAIWTAQPQLPLSRLFAADSAAGTRDNNRSSGYAKALWSDDGIYILAVITDNSINTTNSDYTADCLEVFFNSNLANTGNNPASYLQYRVGAGGLLSGIQATAADAWITPAGYNIKIKLPLPADAANDKLYGFDLQLSSAAANVTGRNSVQMWNNFVGASYQNVTNNGRVKLVGKP
jgi:hypothetical protein